MTDQDPIRKPLQARSRETLHRIFKAAERLMAERPFEKITIQQIVAAAGTTTGAFYTRFKDKDSLLEAMHAQHVADNVAHLEETMEKLSGLPPRDKLKLIVGMIGSVFKSRPALMRSGTLVYWNNPTASRFGATLNQAHKDFAYQIKRVRNEMRNIAEETGHPAPDVAANFALKIALAASRQHYLFADERTILKTTDRAFERELGCMVYAYLKNGETHK